MGTQMETTAAEVCLTEVKLTQKNINNIPNELKELRQWLGWKWSEKANGDKTKVPINLSTLRHGSTTNSSDWYTFNSAIDSYLNNEVDGIGFVFTQDDDYIGIDLDDCVSEGGTIRHPEVDYLAALNSYSEYSPSGTGFKVIIKGRLPDGSKHGFGQGNGIYSEGRFFTITGSSITSQPAPIRRVPQPAIQAMLNIWFPEQQRVHEWEEAEERLTDAEVLRLLHAARNSDKFLSLFEDGDASDYASNSEADAALVSLLAFYTGAVPQQLDRLFRQSALCRDKWDEPRGAGTYGGNTIEWVLSHTEEYYSMGGGGVRGGGERQMMQRETVATGETKAKGFSLLVRGMEDIEEREIAWLWPAHLARGMVHILGGHPGDGKSTLTTAIAATLSTGGVWPDGTTVPVGKTLFLLGEDAPDSVVKPRLLRHGARQRMVSFIEAVRDTGGKERLFDLGKHLETLEPHIVAEGIDLLVIDPLSSFMAGARRNDEGDVRDLLQPLVKMAERTGVAVLCVMHIGKPNGTNRRAAQQLLGSTGFVGLARVVLMVAPQTSDAQDTRRVLAVVKTNIGVRPPGREFDIAGNVIVWGGECRETIETLLAGTAGETDSKVGAAAAFIRTTLQAHSGAMLSKELQRMTTAAGFSEATSRRAREQLGLQFHKGTGKTAQYYTCLPGQQPQGVHGLFNPLDTTMNNLCLPYSNKEIVGCPGEQLEQPVETRWDLRVVHQESQMNNLCLPYSNTEKVQSYSQGAQLAHVSKDEHAVAASGRIVYCENALTAAEMVTEGAWEEWLNSQYRHHDAATGAWPILTAH